MTFSMSTPLTVLLIIIIPSIGFASVKIGALYGHDLSINDLYQVLSRTVDYVNNSTDILPRDELELVLPGYRYDDSDRFATIRAGCSLVDQGATVLVGPSTSVNVQASHPICKSLRIPQISPHATDPYLTKPDFDFLLKMLPPDTYQSLALVGIMRHFGWTNIALMASNTNYGRHGLEMFTRVALDASWDIAKSEVFTVFSNVSMIDARDQLRRIRSSGVRVVILNAGHGSALSVLAQAKALSMCDEGWAWVVTDGVTHIMDNFPIIDIDGFDVSINQFPGIIGLYPSSDRSDRLQEVEEFIGITLDGESMSVVDSVLTVAHGVDKLLRGGHVLSAPATTQGVCSGGGPVRPWSQGKLLLDYMSKVDTPGTRTWINFTDGNFIWRRDYDVLNLVAGAWNKVGRWSYDEDQIIMTGDITFPGLTREVPPDSNIDITQIHFRVTTLLESPFVMINPAYPNRSSEQFIGLSVQLLEALRDSLGFSYSIELVADGKYGSQEKTSKQWNGLMGAIVHGPYDLAVASLTITSEREEFVDFTSPYHDTGYDVLTHKMQYKSNLFDFFNPFDVQSWLALLVATYVCGFAISACSFLSPCGYRGRHIQRLDSDSKKFEKKKDTYNIADAIWFAISSFLIQGPTDTPVSLPGRIVAAMWWGITTIVLAAYTANLTAFLTVEQLASGISSVYDLVRRTDMYMYGTVRDSAVEEFFGQATLDPLPAMYQYMETMDTYVSNATEGIARVKANAVNPRVSLKYALVFDAASLEYAARQEPCVTQLTNKLFRKQGYGLALKKHSPYTDTLTNKILNMRESGQMESMYKIWMAGPCSLEEDSQVHGKQIRFPSLAGIYVLFASAIVIALLIIPIEYIILSYRDVITDRRKQRRNTTIWTHLKRRFAATQADIRDTLCVCRKKEYCLDDGCTLNTDNVIFSKQAKLDHQTPRKEHTPRCASVRKRTSFKRQNSVKRERHNMSDRPGEKQKSNPIFNTEEHLLYMFRKSNLDIKVSKSSFNSNASYEADDVNDTRDSYNVYV